MPAPQHRGAGDVGDQDTGERHASIRRSTAKKPVMDAWRLGALRLGPAARPERVFASVWCGIGSGPFASLSLQRSPGREKMVLSDQQRHGLHGRLEEVLGREHAAALMTQIPPTGWADMATKQDLVLLGERLDARIERVETTLDAKIETSEHRILGALHRELNIQMRITVLALAATGSVIIAAVRL